MTRSGYGCRGGTGASLRIDRDRGSPAAGRASDLRPFERRFRSGGNRTDSHGNGRLAPGQRRRAWIFPVPQAKGGPPNRPCLLSNSYSNIREKSRRPAVSHPQEGGPQDRACLGSNFHSSIPGKTRRQACRAGCAGRDRRGSRRSCAALKNPTRVRPTQPALRFGSSAAIQQVRGVWRCCRVSSRSVGETDELGTQAEGWQPR